jgi:hypothetical protein
VFGSFVKTVMLCLACACVGSCVCIESAFFASKIRLAGVVSVLSVIHPAEAAAFLGLGVHVRLVAGPRYNQAGTLCPAMSHVH